MEAEDEFRKALAQREHLKGAEDPDTLQVCFELALCLASQKKRSDALPYAQRAYQGRRNALGKDHPDTVQALKLLRALFPRVVRP